MQNKLTKLKATAATITSKNGCMVLISRAGFAGCKTSVMLFDAELPAFIQYLPQEAIKNFI